MPDDGAWELAHEAAAKAAVELRPLLGLGEADAILDVMIATWGEHQLLPRELIRALGESGNVPFGAFDGDRMVGFVLGWAGVDARDGLHVHSHMLAVHPDVRHGGIGYALKLAQRAHALGQGITVVRWTFDPMVARNAYFNLHKLGALCDRFERNFYGEMTDTLNRGERSDRLVVRWDLEREPGPHAFANGQAVALDPGYGDLREADPSAARVERERVADAIEAAMGDGLVAAAFDRDEVAYTFAPRGDLR